MVASNYLLQGINVPLPLLVFLYHQCSFLYRHLVLCWSVTSYVIFLNFVYRKRKIEGETVLLVEPERLFQ